MPFRTLRFPLLASAMLILLASIWVGLIRIGWPLPVLRSELPLVHGPLMVSGFLGTLIGLERAVALGKGWAYLVPLATGLGAGLLLAGVPGISGALLITLGSLGLALAFVFLIRLHPAPYTITMALGACAWLVGNLLWLFRWQVYQLVLWWAGFLILTVAGERLELGRIARPSRGSQAAFLIVAGLFSLALVISLPAYDLGTRLAGIAMVALGLWLLKFDLARRTIKMAGLPRFTAFCLLSGYIWLGAAGVFGLIYGGTAAGPLYDAFLHAIFLGFVFSLIFGHAPLIFPAILGGEVRFSASLYAPLGLLHGSLLLRVAGDLAGLPGWRQWGGLVNSIALVLFVGNMGYMVYRGRTALRLRSGQATDGRPGTKDERLMTKAVDS